MRSVLFYDNFLKFQKQSPEVFCKKRCIYKFRKIHRKTPVPQACNFIKKDTLAQLFSSEFCEISKNTFFYRTPLDDDFWNSQLFSDCCLLEIHWAHETIICLVLVTKNVAKQCALLIYLEGIKKCENKRVENKRMRHSLVQIWIKFVLINSALTRKKLAIRTNKFRII